MALLRTLLIGLLVVGFTPGVAELLSDGAHLLLSGHSAHADHHGDHEGPGPEHGCTGWNHQCACHTSLSLIPSLEPALPVAASGGVALWLARRDRGADGVSFDLERPPRA